MNNNTSSHAGRRLYFLQDRASIKKPFARAIGLDTIVKIFEKFVKNGGGIVPWVAPEQGASLHWCKDICCLAPNVVTNT
jgi:hypothetical protein